MQRMTAMPYMLALVVMRNCLCRGMYEIERYSPSEVKNPRNTTREKTRSWECERNTSAKSISGYRRNAARKKLATMTNPSATTAIAAETVLQFRLIRETSEFVSFKFPPIINSLRATLPTLL